MAATSGAAADLEVMDPHGNLRWFGVPGAEYGFCGSCGASLFWRAESAPDEISICAGTLNPPTGLSTVEAWWVSQASDYFARPELPEHATE